MVHSSPKLPRLPILIVALDVPDKDQALSLCDRLKGLVDCYKVGSELFTAAGPGVVEALTRSGARVFLDLKFHDIPNTVGRAVTVAGRWGVHIVDVHTSGGTAMMKAAVESARHSGADGERPLVYGVTVLTHLGDEDLSEIGFGSTSREQVVRLAHLAQESGLDGVVASAHEVLAIREATGDELGTLVPGVRPAWAGATHDQKRVATPADVARAGARYIVVGRAITSQADPRDAASRILEEIESVNP
jgi:orotidine-5'-phosphate decarboxylase